MSLTRCAPLRSRESLAAKKTGGTPCSWATRVFSEFVALNDGVHESQSVMLTVGVVRESVGSVIETRPPNVSWRLPPRLIRVGPNAVAKLAFELIDDSAV